MHPSPILNDYDFGSSEDLAVQDILSDDFQALWHGTGERNREAFKAVFLPVPTDDVRNWKQYAEYLKPHAGISVSPLFSFVYELRFRGGQLMMLDWTCGQQVFELAAGQRGIDEDQRSFGGYAFKFLDCE
jgi:phospholipase D1/2